MIQQLMAACLVLGSAMLARQAYAEDNLGPIPETFAYTQPAGENRVRALLELTGVYTFGFTFYVATNRLLPSYNVGYSWPVFRKKLLGEGLELDVNGLNTNFVGHPAGGSMYYTMARSNQLSVAESAAFAIGGSFLWEMFGEVREFVSINDMVVTPIAGVAIAEPFIQLGAFFDRSGPSLPHRILGVLFAPVKSLNDALDGRHPARTQQLDANGFPTNEYHRFDLYTGAAATTQDPVAGQTKAQRTFEYRLSLASYLVRLPGYDGEGQGARFFGDGNVSSLDVAAGINGTGLVDLDVHALIGVAGYYVKRARHSMLFGLTVGYQYVLHDYDRDRIWPRDRITTVQPLGLVMEQRSNWAALRLVTHVDGGLDFGGLRPYALPAYRQLSDAMPLSELVENNRYCFIRGAHLLASVIIAIEQLEIAGKFRYERYSEIDLAIPVRDGRWLLDGRMTMALGSSAARLSVFVQRRAREGSMGAARAARSDTSLGIELGARY